MALEPGGAEFIETRHDASNLDSLKGEIRTQTELQAFTRTPKECLEEAFCKSGSSSFPDLFYSMPKHELLI